MNKTKTSLLVLATVFVLLPVATYAENASTTGSVDLKQKLNVSVGTHEQKLDATLKVRASSTLPLPPGSNGIDMPGVHAGLTIKASSTATTTRAQLLDRLKAEQKNIIDRKNELKDQADKMRKTLDDRKEAIAEKKTEFKAHFDERRQENIKRLADVMFDRFDAAVDRLKKLADRIDSRLTKLASAGVDVSAYRTMLADARAKIDLAIQANEAAELSAEEITVSDTPKDTFEKCKGLSQEVVRALKAAQQALVDVIAAIKADHPDVEASSSTTASSTVTTQ
jgi:hypothetical protein